MKTILIIAIIITMVLCVIALGALLGLCYETGERYIITGNKGRRAGFVHRMITGTLGGLYIC